MGHPGNKDRAWHRSVRRTMDDHDTALSDDLHAYAARHRTRGLRLAWARRPDIPHQLLATQLDAETDRKVLTELARHQPLTGEQAEQLMGHRSDYVAVWAAFNDNADVEQAVDVIDDARGSVLANILADIGTNRLAAACGRTPVRDAVARRLEQLTGNLDEATHRQAEVATKLAGTPAAEIAELEVARREHRIRRTSGSNSRVRRTSNSRVSTATDGVDADLAFLKKQVTSIGHTPDPTQVVALDDWIEQCVQLDRDGQKLVELWHNPTLYPDTLTNSQSALMRRRLADTDNPGLLAHAADRMQAGDRSWASHAQALLDNPAATTDQRAAAMRHVSVWDLQSFVADRGTQLSDEEADALADAVHTTVTSTSTPAWRKAYLGLLLQVVAGAAPDRAAEIIDTILANDDADVDLLRLHNLAADEVCTLQLVRHLPAATAIGEYHDPAQLMGWLAGQVPAATFDTIGSLAATFNGSLDQLIAATTNALSDDTAAA